jgi:hypothetical protein
MLAKCVCQDVSAHSPPRPDQSWERSAIEESDSDVANLDSDEEITQELCVPTQSLKVRWMCFAMSMYKRLLARP